MASEFQKQILSAEDEVQKTIDEAYKTAAEIENEANDQAEEMIKKATDNARVEASAIVQKAVRRSEVIKETARIEGEKKSDEMRKKIIAENKDIYKGIAQILLK